MDARSEQASLAVDPLPPQTVVIIPDQVTLPDLATLPPLTRALECEGRMLKLQAEIDRLAKQHISALSDQIQDLVQIQQDAIQEAVKAGIERDNRAVLDVKTQNSPRKILAKVLKEKDSTLYEAVILAQEKELDRKKAALKEQTEMPVGVTETCYADLHGKKGFGDSGIFEPVIVKTDYSVISIEAKKIRDQIEASKKAKAKALK
jgi:hypothetical protein